jgi:integrase
MRYSELRLLQWRQVDLTRRTVRVGKSKTETGTGRTVPLNDRATAVLKFWAEHFLEKKPDHYVFPAERYGAGGDTFEPVVYAIDVTRPITSWKEAWESAKANAKVAIRFHDPRQHLCDPDARRRGAALGGRGDPGLEPGDDGPDGQALRAHRAGGAAAGRGVLDGKAKKSGRGQRRRPKDQDNASRLPQA